MDTPLPCRQCGACCFSAAERYVVVTGADWSRLGPESEQLAHFIGHRAYMRMADHHCAALAVRTAENGAMDFFCTVYDRRPEICRTLERGSPECAGERTVKVPLMIALRANDPVPSA